MNILRVRLPSVHLHRDDIETIYGIVKQADGPVSLQDERHKFESIQELLDNRGERLSCLYIHSSSSHISLYITRSLGGNCLIFRGATATPEHAAFLQIHDLLKQRASIFSRLFPGRRVWVLWPTMALYNIFSLAGIPIAYWRIIPSAILTPILISLSLFFIPVMFAMLGTSAGLFNSISLRYRYQSNSFLVRKRDEIILVLIGALLGAIAKGVIDHFFLTHARLLRDPVL
jgi:hypothetical protein